MKRLTDLTSYQGVLPYASEIFGIYQPLLGWKSARIGRRIDIGSRDRVAGLLGRMSQTLAPRVSASFGTQDGVGVEEVQVAREPSRPSFDGLLIRKVAEGLPTKGQPTPEVWDGLLAPKALNKLLADHVVAQASTTYRTLANVAGRDVAAVSAESTTRALLERESRVAGVLSLLREKGQYDLLETLFYGKIGASQALWDALVFANDPFATIDPTSQLDRVGLSPVGIAHLFRQYFFELDTFLGSPVGHVWLSPGSSVELIEVHTRRELLEQTIEQSLESVHKTEKSLTQEDELSDAVKQDNQTNTKLGVNVSANENWGWGSANESASFDIGTTEQHAREQTHKSMRQQSEKLSSEIKQSYKTTFRTVTETTDMSSKRYLLANATDHMINYELRRKMRQVAVQVQDIGSYLCWQTYVDDAGAALGVSRLVHIGTPPDLSKIPPPDTVVPPQPFSEDVQITIPFQSLDDASNDDDFDDGSETSLGFADGVDHIQADFDQGPVRCSQSAFKLETVSVSAEGSDASLLVDPSTIREQAPGAWMFTVHLKHVNFQSQNSLTAKATLNWQPIVDQAAIDKANAAKLAVFTAREEAEFRKAFLDEARERIKLASNIQPRKTEDLREEERVVVYRRLIQDMLAPSSIVPQADPQTHHVVAELLDSIFDVDKLLYFVAPEWWRPRLHRSHQDLGGIEGGVDPMTGAPIAVDATIPKQDYLAWGEGDLRPDSYFITEDSTPARLGSSLGWLLQLDGDDLRNAFLNAPWVKAVMPIRPGRERAALNWLQHVEGMNGIGPTDLYEGPEPEWNGKKTVLEVLDLLAERVSAKHAKSNITETYPLDDGTTIHATPVDRVFEHGFDPLKDGFRSKVGEDFEVYDQWIEVLPTDQVAAVEVTYDPKTGRQL